MRSQLLANRYQLNRHMQHVSEADYYAATDIITSQPVTVRTIDISTLGAVGIGLEHVAKDKLRRKVENEAKIVERLRQLSHPNLLKILADGFENPIYYHIYPPFRFENLQTRMAQELPMMDALAYISQAADVMAFLHRNGIVHCDISADNLVVIEDKIKVIEFSIANFRPAEGNPGNPFYMSPESITGSAPKPARDVWALGVTLVYALTGELPFGSFNMPMRDGVPLLFQAILSTPPSLKTRHLPQQLNLMIHQMLEKDSDKRPGMQQVAEGLASVLKTAG
jgi:eukaryotic-like serine/threonine-protein kinase